MSREKRIKAPTEPGQRHYVLERGTGKEIIVDNFTRKQYSNSINFIKLDKPIPPDVIAQLDAEFQNLPVDAAADPPGTDVDTTDKPDVATPAPAARKAPTAAQKAARAKAAKRKRAAKKASDRAEKAEAEKQ